MHSAALLVFGPFARESKSQILNPWHFVDISTKAASFLLQSSVTSASSRLVLELFLGFRSRPKYICEASELFQIAKT